MPHQRRPFNLSSDVMEILPQCGDFHEDQLALDSLRKDGNTFASINGQ